MGEFAIQTFERWRRSVPAPDADVAAVDVLGAAFAEDPTLTWCFGTDPSQHARRLRGYLQTGHDWHTGLRFGLDILLEQGRADVGALHGVGYYMGPDAVPGPDDLEELEHRLIAACDREPAERFLRYSAVCDDVAPPGRYHVLALLAISPALQGKGLGGRMLRHLQERVRTDPASDGILLDTGNPANVPFYQAHGFRIVAEVALDDRLTETVMFWSAPDRR